MFLLPKPQSIEFQKEHFTITCHGRIVIDQECTCEVYDSAKILKKEIEDTLGYAISITRGTSEKGCIFLKISEALAEDEYTLSVTPDGIEILGAAGNAVLYGIQTLRQIIIEEGAILPCLFIRDYPQIKNRGYYLDVTRGRIPTLAYLKALADKLSFYKINQLQLYIEHSFLFKEISEVWRDDTPLTAEDILELDEYCSRLHIELVPSIASFGHLYKLLRTKTYSHLCELPDQDKNTVFSFEDRMAHHTVDVSNDESYRFIEKMLDEYIPLFKSKQFNICADETFDLGKGKSKPLADKKGVHALYIEYVNRLCLHIIRKGKRPMFWGDIICSFPEAIRELPEKTICLNWGYAPNQSEESTKQLNQAGAIQYLCPGVCGWNQFINLFHASYDNIIRMCSYAHKYKALGVLNTDWGDYGHINHPEFSTAGMIYGAAFSWNRELIPFDEINKQISVLEYEDKSGKFVDIIAAISEHGIYNWHEIVRYMEMSIKGSSEERMREYFSDIDMKHVKEANDMLEEGILKLYGAIADLDSSRRSLVKPYIVAAEGMLLFNSIGAAIGRKKYQIPNSDMKEPAELAASLEYWFYSYKEIWRSVSRESELFRLQNVINWYADYLRELR